LLVGTASLAGRRWGHVISGWLVGIPFTSGPITLFLFLDQGSSFAANAARSSSRPSRNGPGGSSHPSSPG
jgi:hypothetical protein